MKYGPINIYECNKGKKEKERKKHLRDVSMYRSEMSFRIIINKN